MIIWFAVLIPIVAVIPTYVFFRDKLTWWELAVPTVSTTIVVLLCKLTVDAVNTTYTEWWTGYAVKAQYYESWNELVTYTETVDDGNGKSHTETRTRVDYHPAEWHAIDNNDIDVATSSEHFEQLCSLFGNRHFTELHRPSYTKDGDLYETYWPGDDARLQVMTTQHWYTNKIKASDNVLNYPKIDTSKAAVFDYPRHEVFETPSVLSKIPLPADINRDLCILNAKIGQARKIRIWLLVWGPDSSIRNGLDQEAAWVNGNKNELVICVGVNNQYKPVWCHVFSWTKSNDLKFEIRNGMMRQAKLDRTFIDWLRGPVESRWQKRDFKEFSYISVEPPVIGVVISYIIAIATTAGTTYWTIANEFQEFGVRRRRRWA